jgi:hypothetical protein
MVPYSDHCQSHRGTKDFVIEMAENAVAKAGNVFVATRVLSVFRRAIRSRGATHLHHPAGRAPSDADISGRIPRLSHQIRRRIRRALCVGLNGVDCWRGLSALLPVIWRSWGVAPGWDRTGLWPSDAALLAFGLAHIRPGLRLAWPVFGSALAWVAPPFAIAAPFTKRACFLTIPMQNGSKKHQCGGLFQLPAGRAVSSILHTLQHP